MLPTVILTTSPTPSNPSTAMIERVLSAILLRFGIAQAPVMIVCDGCKLCHEDRRKAGRFTAESILRYGQYKANLRRVYQGSPTIRVLEREDRHGFAENIKWGMEQAATEVVLIVQHDHELLREIDGKAIVRCLLDHPEVNYIGFNSYNFNRYDFVGLIHLFPKLVSDYNQSIAPDLPLKEFRKAGRSMLVEHHRARFGLPLFPLVFWYDRVHFAKKDFYLREVFGGKYKVHNFVEDTFGGAKVAEIKEGGLKVFSELGCFIYLADDCETVRHLDSKKKPRPKGVQGPNRSGNDSSQESQPVKEVDLQGLFG